MGEAGILEEGIVIYRIDLADERKCEKEKNTHAAERQDTASLLKKAKHYRSILLIPIVSLKFFEYQADVQLQRDS